MNNKSEQSHPTITVIVPAYNEEEDIARTLTAIRDQTIQDIDLLVVDNNSTDDTVKIAKSFGARVVTESRQGGVYAYDTGMKSATGDIIVNIDADSIPKKDWLERIVKDLQKEDVIGVTGTAIVHSKNPFMDKIVNKAFLLFIGFNFLVGKPHINGFNFAVKRDAFLKTGGMNTKFLISFEVDFGLRLSKFGKVIFDKDLTVVTSTRRWNDGIFKALNEYTEAYFYTIWFRKPPPFKQKVIRTKE